MITILGHHTWKELYKNTICWYHRFDHFLVEITPTITTPDGVYDNLIKLVIVGDQIVGKTSLMIRYAVRCKDLFAKLAG